MELSLMEKMKEEKGLKPGHVKKKKNKHQVNTIGDRPVTEWGRRQGENQNKSHRLTQAEAHEISGREFLTI